MNHSKTQTIRLRTDYRKKYPLEEGKKLQVYLFFKIGDAIITKLETKEFHQLNDEDAKLDGFEDYLDLATGLMEIHGLDQTDPQMPFIEWDVITFKPEWEKTFLLTKSEIKEISLDFLKGIAKEITPDEVPDMGGVIEEINLLLETVLASNDEPYLEETLPNLMKLSRLKI